MKKLILLLVIPTIGFAQNIRLTPATTNVAPDPIVTWLNTSTNQMTNVTSSIQTNFITGLGFSVASDERYYFGGTNGAYLLNISGALQTSGPFNSSGDLSVQANYGFYGDGSGISNIVVTTGTNLALYITSNSVMSIKDGSGDVAFAITDTDGEAIVKTGDNVSLSIGGTISGNGSGLTNLSAAAMFGTNVTVISNSATPSIKLEAGGANTLVVTNGRVGIRTASPAAPLCVAGSGGLFGVNVADAPFGELPGGVTFFSGLNATAGGSMQICPEYIGGTPSKKLVLGYYDGSAFKSALEYSNVASGFSRMVLMKSGGSVGIGTSTPTNALLEVNGGIVCSNLVATNGLYYLIAQTNIGIFTNLTQPTHCFASMTIIGNETVDLIAQSTYYSITNYDGAFTNGFVCVPSAGVITNLVAGLYHVSMTGSGLGTTTNSQLYECGIFTNGVECTAIEWQRTVSSTARGSFAADGILYLPANTGIDARIKTDAASPDDFTFGRFTLTVTSP